MLQSPYFIILIKALTQNIHKIIYISLVISSADNSCDFIGFGHTRIILIFIPDFLFLNVCGFFLQMRSIQYEHKWFWMHNMFWKFRGCSGHGKEPKIFHAETYFKPWQCNMFNYLIVLIKHCVARVQYNKKQMTGLLINLL